MAIVCGPSYGEVEAYPEGIIGALQPRFALVGHWEDFFSTWTNDPKHSVIGTDINRFSARLQRALPTGATWTLPNPGTVVRIPRRSP